MHGEEENGWCTISSRAELVSRTVVQRNRSRSCRPDSTHGWIHRRMYGAGVHSLTDIGYANVRFKLNTCLTKRKVSVQLNAHGYAVPFVRPTLHLLEFKVSTLTSTLGYSTCTLWGTHLTHWVARKNQTKLYPSEPSQIGTSTLLICAGRKRTPKSTQYEAGIIFSPGNMTWEKNGSSQINRLQIMQCKTISTKNLKCNWNYYFSMLRFMYLILRIQDFF